MLDAINAAIYLIDEEPEIASNVLRLARDRLESSWPKTVVKFRCEIEAPAAAEVRAREAANAGAAS